MVRTREMVARWDDGGEGLRIAAAAARTWASWHGMTDLLVLQESTPHCMMLTPDVGQGGGASLVQDSEHVQIW